MTTGLPTPATPGTTQTMTVSGLTPGVLYYFAVRAQDRQYNLSNYVSVSATAKSLPSAGAGVYDDTDSNWVYSAGWTTYSGTGPAANTLHYSNTVGSEAQFAFTGTQFILTYFKASNRGLIDVYVDGTKIDTINAYDPTMIWQATWTSPSFTAGNHTLRFVRAGSSGTYIDIDAIQIQ